MSEQKDTWRKIVSDIRKATRKSLASRLAKDLANGCGDQIAAAQCLRDDDAFLNSIADRIEEVGKREFFDRYHIGRWDGYFEAVGVMKKATREHYELIKDCERKYGRKDNKEEGAK